MSSRGAGAARQNAGKSERASQPKYPKPKILLVDMPPKCAQVLEDAGYNVSVGTFGLPYRVIASDELFYVPLDSYHLPNSFEQEIVIVNTLCPTPSDLPPEGCPGEGVDAIWQDGTAGIIDPRPVAMELWANHDFGRIKAYGGIFIVFVSAPHERTYHSGCRRSHRFGIDRKETRAYSDWGFLSDLVEFKAWAQRGQEISFALEKGSTQFTRMLERAAAGTEYRCAFKPDYTIEDRWLRVACNKYGRDVGGILFPKEGKSVVVILPQMPNAHLMMTELVEQWCASWNPALFPHIESPGWVRSPEYEIPRVVELRAEVGRVRQEAQQKVEDIQADIEQIRRENADWYTLLRGTGDELVHAVIRTLRRLGFTDVRDIDEEAKKQSDNAELREDIQIHDRSPILVVDVKGVAGAPDDDESRQAEKHAIMRMREWNRHDVQPLTIINYQRHLPPLERHPLGYRDEIVKNAEQTHLGLMSTWDLFRLLRGMERLGWPADVIKPVLYRLGRIEPIPEHYQQVGVIAELWKPAFGIVPTGPIQVDDRLAIEARDTFEEITVESLQVDDQPLQEGPAGSNVGIACDNASKRFRKGARVFVIQPIEAP